MSLDNSVYSALSKQVGQFREMDVISNNIANSNTTAYRGENLPFRSHLEFQGKNRDKLAMAQDYATYTDTSVGSAKVTGNQLDFMINGEGYFAVETPAGTRYTRSGNFQVDASGTLVTADGYPVISGGDKIQFQENDTIVEMRGDGTLIANGEERGQLQVVTFPSDQLMERVGNNMYNTNQPPTVKDKPQLAQGVLEASNVKPIIEMTRMMKLSRSVDLTSQMIEDSYELQRHAMSTLSKKQ